jgi:hypothetical protein
MYADKPPSWGFFLSVLVPHLIPEIKREGNNLLKPNPATHPVLMQGKEARVRNLIQGECKWRSIEIPVRY